MRRTSRCVVIACLCSLLAPAASAGLPEAAPSAVQLDAERLARIDAAVERAIEARQVRGAVVLVGRRGAIAYVKAFGKRAVVPDDEPMTRDTAFDMASLTKPMATATSIMILIESGQLRTSDRLGRLLPEFDNHGKGAITVEQLLRHRAGLIADNPIGDFKDGPETAWKNLADLNLTYPPGTSYIYSDVGFMILGRLVEKLSGKPLDVFASENIFTRLGMKDSGFRPGGKGSVALERIAPTEPYEGEMLRGAVHDPRARALGGVAGHAGLFSTADDVAVYAQALLDGGVGRDGARVLGPLTVRRMMDTGDTPAGQKRSLGWDVDTPHSSPRGALFGPESFGHTGFTGTSLWIDPETQTFVVILTSRLHPDGKAAAPIALRSEIATIAASAVMDAPARSSTADSQQAAAGASRPNPAVGVLCGIDVLKRDGFGPLKGKRVGLVTNHTGRLADGSATIDALFKAPEVKLAALFSPEHGIRGEVDAEVSDDQDKATGLPIFSLYGKTRKPTAESLKDLDALVFDIQDIGARIYTYVSTLGNVMEAAKERGIPIYVLDRPNPVGGVAVAGPMRDAEFASFIAFHELPVRHGMTVGELARLFNDERKIGADLHVVPCEGWRREDLYDRTGLLWVNPSPNMRSLNEAVLYLGVGLLEATNLATGRGTDTPFERFGAPWIEPRAFARALNGLNLPGLRFVPIKFTPKERQYANQECGGVYVLITERDRVEPVRMGFAVALTLRKMYRDDWKPDGLLKFFANRAAYDAVLEGRPLDEIERGWSERLEKFLQVRSRYLMYR